MEKADRKNLDSLDLVKFIMSIMVVAIHTRLYETVTFPWLRIAVPVFFIISAYFFFSGIKGKTDIEKIQRLKKFTKRNLQLYLFYFILYLPITLYAVREIFEQGFVFTVGRFVLSFIFGNTFKASWFIVALVIGVAIVFWLSSKLKNITILIITFIVYALVTLRSSYSAYFEDIVWLTEFCEWCEENLDVCYNSFPVGLFWIACGKCFADGTFKTLGKTLNCVIIAVSSVLLYYEWTFIKTYEDGTNDCLFMLVPLCNAVFALFKSINVRLRHAMTLRKLSIMIYTTHASMIVILRDLILRKYDLIHSPQEFVLTLSVTFAVCGILLLLENKTHLKVLKYSH